MGFPFFLTQLNFFGALGSTLRALRSTLEALVSTFGGPRKHFFGPSAAPWEHFKKPLWPFWVPSGSTLKALGSTLVALIIETFERENKDPIGTHLNKNREPI